MADSTPVEAPDAPATDDLSAGTAADLEQLSPPQRTAVRRMIAGDPIVAAAAAAGVNRRTVFRWLKDDPDFLAAYNGWQADQTATARTRVTAMEKGDAPRPWPCWTSSACSSRRRSARPTRPTSPPPLPPPPPPGPTRPRSPNRTPR